jgi:hypothetical protein
MLYVLQKKNNIVFVLVIESPANHSLCPPVSAVL